MEALIYCPQADHLVVYNQYSKLIENEYRTFTVDEFNKAYGNLEMIEIDIWHKRPNSLEELFGKFMRDMLSLGL